MQQTTFDTIQGDTFAFDVYYTDAVDNPINISNYHVVAEVKDKPGGKILCAMADMNNGISLIDFPDVNNAVHISFSPAQTAKFISPKSAFQVKIVETGDTLLVGWINVEAGIINV